MIEVRNLTKRYGRTLAVDDLSFRVRPGRVTGFLGPNGAGKSTTMGVILGLAAPTSGAARVAGQRYQDLRAPLRRVGRCSTPRRSPAVAGRGTTGGLWPAATGSPERGSTGCLSWWAWPR